MSQATVLTFTISAGQSLSNIVDISAGLVGIKIPDLWDAAAITFLGSGEGLNQRNIWDGALATAAERTIASASIPTSGGRLFTFSLNDWLGVNFLQIRSGISGAAVTQTAERAIRGYLQI